MSEPQGHERWGLVCSFFIDTDGYTARDREMFVCGVEFSMVFEELKTGNEVRRPIHPENESRIRMMCGAFNRRCTITPTTVIGWSDLLIEKKTPYSAR